MLRKNDPVYYKMKLNKLIKQALVEGLQVECEHLENGARISFVCENGDVAGLDLLENTK